MVDKLDRTCSKTTRDRASRFRAQPRKVKKRLGLPRRLGERNVELSRQRSGLDPVCRLEPDGDGGALARVADRLIETVARLQRLAGHIHLGNQLAPARRLDREVDMR